MIGLVASCASDGQPNAGPASPATPGANALRHEVVLADLEVEPLAGIVVVSIDDSDSDDIGPVDVCCFDLGDDGQVHVVDSRNARIVSFGEDGSRSVLAQFDPDEFNPDAIAVHGGRVVVVGPTTRPGAPYDAVVVSLADGEVLMWAPAPAVDMTGDLRSTDAGVFWSRSSPSPEWHAVADENGDLVSSSVDTGSTVLPGTTSIEVDDGSTISISVHPEQSSLATTFTVIDGPRQFVDVLGAGTSSAPDSILVVLGYEAGGTSVTVLDLGTPPDGRLAANAFGFDLDRASGADATNRFRFGRDRIGNPALYALSTDGIGFEILRYAVR